MTGLAIIVLAAGSARRMRGRDKLMETINGTPLIARQLGRAIATGLTTYVALSPDHPARADAIEGLNAVRISVPDAADGMAMSLRGAIAALPAGHTGAMVVLADMPEITTDDMITLRDAFDADPRAIIRATSNGVQGHPVVFPADLFPDLAAITGDTGAKPVIMAHKDRLHLIPLPEGHATTDLDTPEAWDDWRARTNTPT